MSEPSQGASKIYTKTGDQGKTSLVAGTRVSKSDARLEAYGTVDELNSLIGLLNEEIKTDLHQRQTERDHLLQELALVQNDLFDLGSRLACEDPEFRHHLPEMTNDRIRSLESAMDSYSKSLKPLRNFVLPGGAKSSATAHLARTVCRRAERIIVALQEGDTNSVEVITIQYLNRLSDYFFVVARYLNHVLGVEEPTWAGKSRK